jgi:hemerythrin-like metal-binding protein
MNGKIMSRMNRERRTRRKPTRHIVVGHSAIDTDHQEIIECCNGIVGSTSATLELQLHRLRSLLASHFQHEELLLKQVGSKLCECHSRDHKLFLEMCDKAIHGNSRKLIVRDLLPALRDHIAYRDQLIALHLNSVDTASPPRFPRNE